jgi:hypothetical protein
MGEGVYFVYAPSPQSSGRRNISQRTVIKGKNMKKKEKEKRSSKRKKGKICIWKIYLHTTKSTKGQKKVP